MNSNENLSKIIAFDNKSYYWRSVLGGTNDSRYLSKIYFDIIEDIGSFKSKSNNQNLNLFQGVYPHIQRLQYDPMSESIACFFDFYSFVVFPLLHLRRIKVKIAGKRNSDSDILATKLS